MGGNKRSNLEIEAITNQICLAMIRGLTRRADIFQYISNMDKLDKETQVERNWVKVGTKSDRMIDHYIQKAKEMFLEFGNETRDNVRALYIARLEDLYKLALSKDKIQTANHIMKNMMYLQGLGGFNISGNFSIKNFDIPLSEGESAAYKERLKDVYGESFEKEEE